MIKNETNGKTWPWWIEDLLNYAKAVGWPMTPTALTTRVVFSTALASKSLGNLGVDVPKHLKKIGWRDITWVNK